MVSPGRCDGPARAPRAAASRRGRATMRLGVDVVGAVGRGSRSIMRGIVRRCAGIGRIGPSARSAAPAAWGERPIGAADRVDGWRDVADAAPASPTARCAAGAGHRPDPTRGGPRCTTAANEIAIGAGGRRDRDPRRGLGRAVSSATSTCPPGADFTPLFVGPARRPLPVPALGLRRRRARSACATPTAPRR